MNVYRKRTNKTVPSVNLILKIKLIFEFRKKYAFTGTYTRSNWASNFDRGWSCINGNILLLIDYIEIVTQLSINCL